MTEKQISLVKLDGNINVLAEILGDDGVTIGLNRPIQILTDADDVAHIGKNVVSKNISLFPWLPAYITSGKSCSLNKSKVFYVISLNSVMREYYLDCADRLYEEEAGNMFVEELTKIKPKQRSNNVYSFEDVLNMVKDTDPDGKKN